MLAILFIEFRESQIFCYLITAIFLGEGEQRGILETIVFEHVVP